MRPFTFPWARSVIAAGSVSSVRHPTRLRDIPETPAAHDAASRTLLDLRRDESPGAGLWFPRKIGVGAQLRVILVCSHQPDWPHIDQLQPYSDHQTRPVASPA
jgi:hypothetical protein